MYGTGLQAQLRLRALLHKREQLAQRNGIAFYQPHKKQDWFHRHGGYKYRYGRTGNRFGKSDMGAAEDVAFALGERPWYPKDDPARYEGIPRKSTSGVILCTNWQKADEIFTSEEEGTAQGKLFKFIPKESLGKVTRVGGHVVKIMVRSIWGGWSSIRIDTIVGWKQDNQKSESSSYDWIHVDEPVPKKMYQGFARGLMDRNGKVWFTCTPIREPWINSFFVPHRRHKVKKTEPNYHGKDRVMIIGSSFDNPYNSEEGMKSYLDDPTMDESTKKARIEGEPVENSGVIYHMFGEQHIYTGVPDMPDWVDAQTPPTYYTYRYHLDTHGSLPNAAVFVATAPDNSVWMFDELWLDADPETIATIIKDIHRGGRWMANELVDPSAFNKQMDRKTTFGETLVEHGLMVEKAAKDPRRGIIEAKAFLNQKMPNGSPRFRVSENCVHFLQEIDEYVWGDIEKRPDRPVDKNDHFMEGFYRLVLNGLDYIDQSQFDNYKSKPDIVSNYIFQ